VVRNRWGLDVFVENARTVPLVRNVALADVGLERWNEGVLLMNDKRLADAAADIGAGGTGSKFLRGLFSASPYLTRLALRDQAIATQILTEGPDGVLVEVMTRLLALEPTELRTSHLMTLLRVAKRHAALAIGLADVMGVWDLERVVQGLSDLADQAIELSWRHALADSARLGKLPIDNISNPLTGSGLICLAMGKLGARELNYSSDIDLVVFYDDEHPKYQEMGELQLAFVQATQLVVKLLEERTPDGYVFRTDLRLRPDASATPVAVSTSAAEIYYESFGQNWERAAFIRARAVGGDQEAARKFLERLRAFVWRRHLDFAAIQDVRSIKRQIVAHKGGGEIAVEGHNLKLGRGGIREIEFFVQTQQLIWGGRDANLRQTRTVDAMEALVQAGRIKPHVAEVLLKAYRYLRHLEHRIQMINDSQTHELPENLDELQSLAAFLGMESAEDLRHELLNNLLTVASHYGDLFQEDAPLTASGLADGSLVFTGVENDPETLVTLERLGYRETVMVSMQIRSWHHGRYRATRSERSRQLLTEMVPALLRALSKTAQPDEAFRRFDRFLEALPAGVQLFSLILANPTLLDIIADIMGMAPSLADNIGLNPALFEGLLTHDLSHELPGAKDLSVELCTALDREKSYEQVLDTTRRWINDRRFQVGVQVLSGRIDTIRASRAISDIVDSAVHSLLPRVEAEFAIRHGRVPGTPNPALAVLAMGKFGGRELTVGSDLDLVFLHDGSSHAQSDGEKPLGGNHYFIRLGQRLIAALTAKTAAGGLFEVDMRLRPNGAKAPVACSLESFRKYHEESSWIWEHMALTRARLIAGAPGVAEAVYREIRAVLCRERDPETLRKGVAIMRRRIDEEHHTESLWQLKYWRGGLIDAEFIVQFLILKHAAAHPEVIRGNTVQATEALGAMGALETDDAADLAAAVRLYRNIQGLLRLTVGDAFDPVNAPEPLKMRLVQLGDVVDFRALEVKIQRTGGNVATLFDRIVETPA